MALEAALLSFQAETKCPVCLQELTDPVTIECGHNFCRSCIQQSWAEGQGRWPCPVCRHPCSERDLPSNGQLGRIAQLGGELRRSTGQRARRGAACCETHGRGLTLFCEDDLETLCPRCAEPHERLGHRLTPSAEAARHHRRKLRGFVEPLKRQMEAVHQWIGDQSERPSALREQMEAQRRRLSLEFEHLNGFLDREERAATARLVAEEERVRRQLGENIEAFSSYGSTLKGLLGKLVERRAIPDEELLTEVNDFYDKCDRETSPSVFPARLTTVTCNFPPQCSALERVIKEFRADVILDPETAHPNLVVSEDKTGVRFSKRNKQRVSRSSRRFTVSPVVLGLPDFSSGRHFWEVQVGDKSEWALGVCKACPSKRERQEAAPQRCWRMLLREEGYEAPGADPAPLPLEVKARRIGILLDYELGQLSFYNMPEKLHICTLQDTFTEPLQPYFYVGPHSQPLQICTTTTE